MSGRSLSGVLRIFCPGGLVEPLRRFLGADAKRVHDPAGQALVAAGLPKAGQAPQHNRAVVFILKLCEQRQRLQIKVCRLCKSPLLLRDPAQLVIGYGLAVAVVELDIEGEGLLVKLLGASG